MKIYQLTILLLTSVISTSVFANIPDLFGAYQSGAYQAQQDNYRDDYYYQQMNQPKLYIEVWDKNFKKKRRSLKISLKKKNTLCWSVYPVPVGQVYYASELFTMPVNAKFTGFSGQNSENKITSAVQVSANSAGFDRQIYSSVNQINSCWKFPANTPTGQYYLSLSVGDRKFGTRAFQIVK